MRQQDRPELVQHTWLVDDNLALVVFRARACNLEVPLDVEGGDRLVEAYWPAGLEAGYRSGEHLEMLHSVQ